MLVIQNTPAAEEVAPVVVQQTVMDLKPEYGVDLGVGTATSKFHFGAGVRTEWALVTGENVYHFGLQSGFYYGTGSGVKDWIVPILAIARYDIKVSTPVKPYFGVGLGAVVIRTTVTGTVAGITASGSDTSTKAGFVLKPGLNIGNDSKVYIELPLGLYGDDFTLIPTLGMRF